MVVWVTTKSKKRKIKKKKEIIQRHCRPLNLFQLWAQQKWATGFIFTLFVHSYFYHIPPVWNPLKLNVIAGSKTVEFHAQKKSPKPWLEFRNKRCIFQECLATMFQSYSIIQSFIVTGFCYSQKGVGLYSVIVTRGQRWTHWQPGAKGPVGRETWQVSGLILFSSGRHTSHMWGCKKI